MNYKYLYQSILFTVLVLVTADCFAQRIENVHPEIIEDKIHIYYDLIDIAADQPVIVRVFISTDGGKTYGEPLKSVTGDVGIVVGSGENKRIVWNVFEEVDELISENVKFMIKADLLQSDKERRLNPGYSLNLNAELGSKVKLNAYGFNLKAAIYLSQLGLGVRGNYYKTYGENPDNSDFGYYWGFAGGAIVEYDIIRNRKYSLYPFMYVGQTKIQYIQKDLTDEHSGYSIFYSPGIGFNINIIKFIYLGVEFEYYMTPRFDIIDRGSSGVYENIILDGFSLGIVLKFVKHPK